MMTTSSPPLTITPGALASVLVSCWGEYPNAAYGALVECDGHLLRILMQATAASAASASCKAELPEDRVHAALQRAGEPVLLGASFHAHLNGPPRPSRGDLDRLATHPDRPMLIVSLQDIDAPDIRAWTITDGQPHELRLELVSLEAIDTTGRGQRAGAQPGSRANPGGDPSRR